MVEFDITETRTVLLEKKFSFETFICFKSVFQYIYIFLSSVTQKELHEPFKTRCGRHPASKRITETVIYNTNVIENVTLILNSVFAHKCRFIFHNT
jgi:hypothetical protein